MSGLDQARAIDIVNATTGYSCPGGGTSSLTNGFHGGASNQGHVRLMTVNGSSTANGTELGSSGSYVAGTGIVYTTGSAGSFAIATYSSGAATGATNTTLSQTGMPAATIVGIETWDSAGTPLRWWWGALFSNVSTNSGDTLSFASAAISAILTA